MQPSFEGFDDIDPVDDGGNPTYTVSELIDDINDTLRRRFFDGVWVRGEIAGLKNAGAHTYFSLVEDGPDGRAVINVQLFAPVKRRLTPMLKKNRLRVVNGLKVRINGQLDVYAPGGRLGVKMTGLDPTFTLGELSQEREAVVQRLVSSGLFDANRRHRLPDVPLRIGVVASVGSAAWHDFRDELARSGIGFELLVADSRVQGDTAIDLVCASIRALARRQVDAIVVIRGGGARTELAVFDAEPIAIAIATSPVPVLTGLGHETDRSVADDVAHTSEKTPTAVARFLVEQVETYRTATETCFARVLAVADRHIERADERLVERARSARLRTLRAVDRADDRLDGRRAGLVRLADDTTRRHERRLEDATQRIARVAPRHVSHADQRLELIEARLAGVDPIRLMRRGWSITRRRDTGRAVGSVDDVEPGVELITQLRDGVVISTVDDAQPHPPADDTDGADTP